jgi:hypothetical protein
MIEAMIEVDPSKIIKKQTTRGFQEKWITPASKGKLTYLGEPQELACRDLLKIAETLHNQGINRLPMFSHSAFERAKDDEHTTFAARIDKICNFLSRSKNKVETILRGDGLVPFVASVTAKMKENKQLREQMKPVKGKAAKKNEDDTVKDTMGTEETRMVQQDVSNLPSQANEAGLTAQDLDEFGQAPWGGQVTHSHGDPLNFLNFPPADEDSAILGGDIDPTLFTAADTGNGLPFAPSGGLTSSGFNDREMQRQFDQQLRNSQRNTRPSFRENFPDLALTMSPQIDPTLSTPAPMAPLSAPATAPVLPTSPHALRLSLRLRPYPRLRLRYLQPRLRSCPR